MFSGSNPAMAAAHPDGSRFEESAVKSGGREGFIPAPGELVSKGLFELSEYPYLRKYLGRIASFPSLVPLFTTLSNRRHKKIDGNDLSNHLTTSGASP
jgi:hypothetical protein